MATPEMPWLHPSEPPRLRAVDVHVWRASLCCAIDRFGSVREILSEDERHRANRLHVETQRRRFIVARTLLRVLLGHYLGRTPGSLRFTYGPQGKPTLEQPPGPMSTHFSVAHSGDLGLYAVTLGRKVGIDVERIRPGVNCGRIAERFFSPAEISRLRTAPLEARTNVFFSCWTRREAQVKAAGTSLWRSFGPSGIGSTSRHPATRVTPHEGPPQSSQWSIRELYLGTAFAAAIAVEGCGWDLTCWQWPEQPHSLPWRVVAP